jgi:hypothetical protein
MEARGWQEKDGRCRGYAWRFAIIAVCATMWPHLMRKDRPMLKLSIRNDLFYLGETPTYTQRSGFPHADPRLKGLLLNHRVINGIFDDLNPSHDYDGDGRDDFAYPDTGVWDPDVNTLSLIEAMRTWREQGVIAFTIGLQGGNPYRSCPIPPGLSTEAIDGGAFNPDGSLRRPFMTRLKWVLDAAAELDMVPIINYFYQGGVRRIAEDRIESAVDNATQWLLDQDYTSLVIDLANECSSGSYWPALRPDAIHGLLYRIKDTVDLRASQDGRARRFWVGASLGPRASRAEALAELPAAFLRASDLLMLHGNELATADIRAAIVTARERMRTVLNRQLPIVYNEDIQATPTDPTADNGGDLAHLEACIEAGASWGNLIRSHQQVPCLNWCDGTPVQRAWFARTRQLAGAPTAPSSVLHFYHNIKALHLAKVQARRTD